MPENAVPEGTIEVHSDLLDELKVASRERGFETVEAYIEHLHRKLNDGGKADWDESEERTDIGPGGDKSRVSAEIDEYFSTDHGKTFHGDAKILLERELAEDSVDLVVTSPPFGLVREKAYGNKSSEEYVDWFRRFVPGLRRVLKETGSLVIDIGGAWEKGTPTRSLYHFDLVRTICRDYGFHLAQEFYWWNPSKLPTPAEWVTVRRIRVKDAVNCVWWLSPTPYPKASNRRVLQPYSDSMEKLLKDGYTPKERPSGHKISNKFDVNNRGAIPPNLIALANTESNSTYQRYCREHSLQEHPARFPAGLPGFFVRMLTDKNDLVVDPFAGSCVTGEVCELMGRRWVCCDLEEEYLEGARGRFEATERDLFSFGQLNGREEPYEIYPPTMNVVDESEVELREDGGRTR